MDLRARLNSIADGLHRISVKALIFNAENRVLLCQEKEGWWNFPGGGLVHGESPESALKRELLEELAISEKDKIDINPHVEFIAFGISSKNIPKANLFYKTKISTTNITPTKKIPATKWITPGDVPNLTWAPGLGNPQTLAANLQKLI